MARGLIGAGLLATAIFALDQWTKAAIAAGLGPGASRQRVGLAGNWFALEYAENRGTAFGLLAGAPALVTVLAVLVLVGVVAFAVRRRDRSLWLLVGLGLLVGGAVGNLSDRLRLGYVVDFVAIGPWPNFNVADAAISVGILCLAVDALVDPGPAAPPASAPSRAARHPHE